MDAVSAALWRGLNLFHHDPQRGGVNNPVVGVSSVEHKLQHCDCIRPAFERKLCAMKASRAVLVTVLLAAVLPSRAWSQAPPTAPKFDVASIKQNKSGDGSLAINTNPGGRFDAVNGL